MALASLRLRRALFLSPALLKQGILQSSSISTTSLPFRAAISPAVLSPSQHHHQLNQRHSFRSSSLSFDNRRSDQGDGKISPDEILFEGCDYNHWLITMDFPKDPKPTPEQMVDTYVETLAKVVGSKEEAMKKMYACSTTTYNGFQAVMTEEMSEKFRGLPGVVFILPDSYIDPVNKEYGGDKYEMGKITPRPPPVQYGRQGRYGDRNRNYERPRFDRPADSMPMQTGNPPPPQYNQQGPRGDGQNYAQQRQPYSQSGQQPPAQGYGVNPRPFAGQQESSQYDRRGPVGQSFQTDFQREGRAQASYQQTGFNQVGGVNFGTQGQGRVPQMQYGGSGETFQQGSRPGFQDSASNNMHNENPSLNSSGNFQNGQQQRGFNQFDNVNIGTQPQGRVPQAQYGGPGGTFQQGSGPSGPGFQSQNTEAINNTGNVHTENPNMNSPGRFPNGQEGF